MNIIYKHTNSISGASYIGKTNSTIEKRLQGHINAVKNGCDYAFHRGIRKYGIDNFKSEILESNIPDDLVDERESYWIGFLILLKGMVII